MEDCWCGEAYICGTCGCARFFRSGRIPASHDLAMINAPVCFNSNKSLAMQTHKSAPRLAELCNQGKFEAAQKELYADDAVSIEQHETPDFPKETKGLRNIIEKGHK